MKYRKQRAYLSPPQATSAILCLIVWSISVQCANAQPAPQIEWARYLPDSRSTSIASDPLGNVYISGNNLLPGAFLAKFDSAGSLLWQQQWGEGNLDPLDMAVDGLGNVYITGRYSAPSSDYSHAMLTKFDNAGNFHWMRQISVGDTTSASSLSADSMGNLYLGGDFGTKTGFPFPSNYDYDGFVSRFDADGNRQWLQKVSSPDSDSVDGVATDDQGDAFFTGGKKGSLIGPNPEREDIIVGKFDRSGTLLWSHQIPTQWYDESRSIAVAPGGRLYLATSVESFLRQYDSSGNELWTRQINLGNSFVSDLTTDDVGNAYLAGSVFESPGITDAFAAKYDSLGNLKWNTTFGTHNLYDEAWGISAQSSFGIYIGGSTRTTDIPLDGSAFVIKLVETPEPAGGVMALAAVMMFGGVCRFRQRYVVAN